MRPRRVGHSQTFSNSTQTANNPLKPISKINDNLILMLHWCYIFIYYTSYRRFSKTREVKEFLERVVHLFVTRASYTSDRSLTVLHNTRGGEDSSISTRVSLRGPPIEKLPLYSDVLTGWLFCNNFTRVENHVLRGKKKPPTLFV